jgi:alpha-N-arabinofuranosidase
MAGLAGAGGALAAGSWLSGVGHAQGRGPARATAQRTRSLADMDRRLLGAFLEHLGRAIYTGVYEPGSKLADASGFRRDVIAEVKGLGRADHALPRRKLRVRLQLARRRGAPRTSGRPSWSGPGTRSRRTSSAPTTSSSGASSSGTEPLLGFNLGTGTPEQAVAYVEYCNVDKGTKWSDLRREHGYEAPHNVKYWCLGNEMDGPWQMGTMTAREYGRKARDSARQIRVVDPTTQLIACGSSNTILPTYLVWDREVLEECYDQVDGISLHNYYGNTPALSGGDTSRYLAMNLDMERQIQEIAAVCDYVQGLRKSPKRLWLSFDEWNVWYRARGGTFANGQRKFAPPLLEEVYNLEDALLDRGLREHAAAPGRRVRVGCLAQIVNVIAPLVTNETVRPAPEHLLPVRVVPEVRARTRPRSPRGRRDLPDQGGGAAAGLRARRRRPLCRRGPRPSMRRTGSSPCSCSTATSRASASWSWTAATSRPRGCWPARR